VALLPPAEIRCEGFHNLAVVRMDPAAVAAAAAAMAGVDGWSGPQSLAFVNFPAQSLPPAAPLARSLHCLLGSLDCCLESEPRLAAHLGIDEVILRSVASWLRPELLERDQGTAVRERFNTSPKQWIRVQRLDKAMELLRKRPGNRSIREIALTCGYTHMGHFSRQFKELQGCKPSEAMAPRD
jgi:AraC-type DNA-binding domain-containing proteins